MADMPIASSEHGLDSKLADPVANARAALFSNTYDLRPTIAQRVIPRLHAAMQKDLQRPRHPLISADVAATCDDVSELSSRLLRGDVDEVCDRIEALRREGRSLEHVYLKLLAPMACHLRDLWSDDLCGFADVTFALNNLQAIVRRYASDFYAEASRPETSARVLLVAPAGDSVDMLTPMFGLVLMSQFFRRDGWDASIERDLKCEMFRKTIGEWFDMVEVLAANDSQLDEIASGIRTIRRGSPNPSLGIIVCGKIFSERPDYIRLVGADLMADDPLSSLSQAKSFMRQTEPLRLS